MVAALALLASSMLLPALLRGNWVAWVCLPFIAGGLWAIQHSVSPVLALYIAPIIGPSFMAWVFGHTLMPGETPLIEQFVRIMHSEAEPPDESVWPYARRLTSVWTMLFVALALTNLTLAALAEPDGLLLANGIQPPFTVPQEWWSLFANILDYILVAVFFMIEYAYRRRRFPRQPFRNFYDFLKQAGAAMPKLMKRNVQR
jgi:uncharacterized membrane protein